MSVLRKLKLHFPKLRCIRNMSLVNEINRNSDNYDVVVVGGGIVGVASARELLKRHPNLKMAIVEKEPNLATHQSGHNSGVIQAGIYYKPRSLNAKLCVEGSNLTYKYLNENNLPYRKIGKLIVATSDVEAKRLDNLYENGRKNGVADLALVDAKQIQDIEPNCRGVRAIWSPNTGIVDYVLLTEHFANDFKALGGHIHMNFEVSNFYESNDNTHPVQLLAKNSRNILTKHVLVCSGLYSDKLAQLSGCSRYPRIVPIRGEYLLLKPEKSHLLKTNIYPVPDPRYPFLGVHFTRCMDGSVLLGPNAVLAFQREGYSWFNMNFSELKDDLRYAGFRKLARRYFKPGVTAFLKSIVVSLQVKDLQKYVPDLTVEDVIRGGSGVRAQAVDVNGNLVEDIYFDVGDTDSRILHCRNAYSPGATSALAVAKFISDKLERQFQISN